MGELAPAEAMALCAVRHFVERRYQELRRWVVPQAVVDSDWIGYAELGAEAGEQLILDYHHDHGCANAGNSKAWTWRGQDTAECIIGDMLCDLMQAGDRLGIDFWAALASAERYYDEEAALEAKGVL